MQRIIMNDAVAAIVSPMFYLTLNAWVDYPSRPSRRVAM